jgi:GT2 family glycosyltransferase
VTGDVSAVVLAYGDEPWVERCIDSILASTGVTVEAIVVDNGCTTGAVDRLDGRAGVTVLRPGRNLGFAGGSNAGAAVATGEVIALINADALVEPDALACLHAAVLRPGVGIGCGGIRLADDPSLLNSAGNPLHYLGVSWAGSFGEPAARYPEVREVAVASGAGLAMRRSLWEELGGFAPEYFAYHEDTELSVRVWQRGLRVLCVPDAVVVHRYEFSRNPRKFYLLERNRLLFLLTTYEVRTLLLLLPALVAFELAMAVTAALQGWLLQKVRGWAWVIRHIAWVRERRARLQGERLVPDCQIAPRLEGRITPANLRLPPGFAVVNALLAAYWRIVRRFM